MAPIERKNIDLSSLKKSQCPGVLHRGPGSGKGTQCEKIVAKYGLTHLSSGDLLREEVKSGSPRGGQLTKMMQAGELVPLEIVLDLIKEAMVKAIGKKSNGFLIDGYPREIQPSKLVIFLDVSEETLVSRCMKRGLTSGRVDDNVETITKRLQTFQQATKPVIDHYEKKNKLVRIKGEGSVDEIFAEVIKHLNKAMSK
ncbi:Adenylate kinase isoenzyme 1 [Aphelenchoides besseyi]|nr:Adenylate kinase isoenzyme 1 [Aphelenchoides besseyi]